jgi:hypothetical protein
VRRLLAGSVAAPVRAAVRDGDTGVVLGSGVSAAYVDFGGFVVAVTAPGVSLMPNGVSLAAARPDFVQPRAPTVARAGGLQVGEAFIDYARAATGRTMTPINPRGSTGGVAERGLDLLRWAKTLSLDGSTVGALGDALMQRDPSGVEGVTRSLLGRGSGLTPEGDDLLTGCAAGIVAFARPTGIAASDRDRWLACLCPADARTSTTSLSATLLELACSGHVPEPLAGLLDLDRAPERVLKATRVLEAIGHSTGRAWMTGCGIAATCLASNALVAGPIWM